MKRAEAEKIVKNHVMWAMGGGLVPLPFLDLAAVTAVQLGMFKQLTELYGVDFDKASTSSLISALTGSTFAKLGASVLKAIPGVGSILGGLSMSLMSGASTFAIGQVAIAQLSGAGGLMDMDMDKAKDMYADFFEKGKEFISNLENEKSAGDSSSDVLETLEKLGALREQGVVTDEEFEAKKAELLAKL